MRISDLLLLAGICLVAACARHHSVPDLPTIDTTKFQPAVRRVVDEALEEARVRSSDAEATAGLGMVLHAHDQFAAAVSCYRRASRLDSTRAAYPYYEGAALVADGKNGEAVEPLSRAVQLDPKLVPARLKLADALFDAGQPQEAAKQYRMVIGQDSSIAAAHYGLARTMHGEPAIAEFRKSLELFPRYGAAQFALAGEYRKAGRRNEAEDVLRGYEQNRTKTPPMEDPLLGAVFALNTGSTGMIRRAQALERAGQLADAAQMCERVVAQDPKFVDAWINLVSLYGRLGEVQRLERAYAQAVSQAPDRAESYYNFGVFCLTANRLADARKAFTRVTELDPGNAEGWNNLAAVIERSGALEQAAGYYRRAIELRPDGRESHFGLGRIYANQGKYAEAISQLDKTIQPEDDQTPGYLYALGAVHGRAGHRRESIDWLTKAREKAAGRGQNSLVASIERDIRTLGASR